jgi:hypothetical protein
MGHTPNWDRTTLQLVLGGLIFSFIAVIEVRTGEAFGRGGEIIYRSKNPYQYWMITGLRCLLALFCIGGLVYQIWFSDQ